MEAHGSDTRLLSGARKGATHDSNDTTIIDVEVATGEGATIKLQLPRTATVLMAKEEVERMLGIRPREARVFSINAARTEKLMDEETLVGLLMEEGQAKLELLLLVEQADAQQVVPELPVEPSLILGDWSWEEGRTQFSYPTGAAFIAAHPDWLITTEEDGHCIKISNIRTGAMVCKFGEYGGGEGQFHDPSGVAVTSDSSFVIVADYGNTINGRVQVLRLVAGADSKSAHMEFVRSIGSGQGIAEGELDYPKGIALLPSNGGQQETVLATETRNHRVSQFALLDGTFVGIFAGTGKQGSGDGEFRSPAGIAVLHSSGEVAVADRGNHRVQIFDSEGKYKRQFGTRSKEIDGELYYPLGLASDAHGNLLVMDETGRLQVFSPEGKHLCTRSDLGLQQEGSEMGIAWSAGGEIAVADGRANKVFLWHSA
jgi:DNA-binding beta-propeller fold protein YncE